jgi:RNA polymerase sigma-70 factor (ECF subfamily)
VADLDFQALVEEHYDRLFRAARFMCADTQAAEDLVQETFLAAGETLDRFQGRSAAYTWLYGILLNKWRRWLRGRSRRTYSLQAMAWDDESTDPADLVESERAGPAEDAEGREAAERVRRAIEELPEDHRAVVVLRFVEDLSYQEICETLNCPLGTVKSRIHYALKRIGKELERVGLGPD